MRIIVFSKIVPHIVVMQNISSNISPETSSSELMFKKIVWINCYVKNFDAQDFYGS